MILMYNDDRGCLQTQLFSAECMRCTGKKGESLYRHSLLLNPIHIQW